MTDDLPHPALLNTWKHHAGWIRGRIAAAVSGGSAGIAALPAEMVVVGSRLMDLYTGSLTPAEIAEFVIAELKAHDRFEFDPLAAWLAQQGAYALTDLPDGSTWTIRLGPADARYLHLHPGRWAEHTMRVQANTLKSAVMAHAQRAAQRPRRERPRSGERGAQTLPRSAPRQRTDRRRRSRCCHRGAERLKSFIRRLRRLTQI